MSWSGREAVVLGGFGFLGTALSLRLQAEGARVRRLSRANGWDLRDPLQACGAMAGAEVVFNCAAHQGGIAYQARHPETILSDNLRLATSCVDAAVVSKVRYVNIASSCAYPDMGVQLREEMFESGPMHPSIANYGLAKRVSVALVRYARKEHGLSGISLVLANMYGPGDHDDPERSHALSAILRKFMAAAQDPFPVVWGTGKPVREWLFVDDAVEGILRATERYDDPEPLNIGTGDGVTIATLASTIARMCDVPHYSFDPMRPDGAPYKVLDVTKMERLLGWRPTTALEDGIRACMAA